MSSDAPHIAVAPGNDLVARFGSATAVIRAQPGSGESPFTSALLGKLDALGRLESTEPADVAWAVAQLLIDNRESIPDFGVIIQGDEEYSLLLRGNARVLVCTAEGELELDGARTRTWLDHVVSTPVDRICLTLSPGGMGDVDPRSDLRAGLVAGGGVVLTPIVQQSGDGRATEAMPAVTPLSPLAPASPTGAPPTPPVPVTASQPDPVSVPEPVSSPAPAPSAPALPSALEPASSLDASGTMPNAAGGSEAARSTSSLPPTSHTTATSEPASGVEHPRSLANETVAVTLSAGMLVADDGSRTPLDRDYIFGRDPSQEASKTGTATPIVVRDPDNLVSRVQMYLSVDNGLVQVRDAGSANGTFLAAPGADGWTRLTAAPTELPEGWSVRLGQRIYTYVAIAP